MTRPTRAGALLRGVSSLILFLSVLLGPPIALTAAVGWPLPSSIPDLDAINRAARSGVGDEFIVNTLAVIVWLAWAQIALALLVEAAAVVRGRPAIHLPVLPGVQTSAARLVAGIAMMLTTATPTAAMASPLPIHAVAPVVAVDQTPRAAVASWSSAPKAQPPPSTAPAPAPTPAPTVTVQRHDTYWAIAERHLGDGLRWSEVRDLNVGRTMPDGHVIVPGSDLLRPNWVLELPARAEAGQTNFVPSEVPSIQPAPERAPAEVTVVRSDNLWTLAEQELGRTLGRTPTVEEVRPYWRDLVAANEDRLVEANDPGLVFAGQVLALPRSLPPVVSPPKVEPAPDPPSAPPAGPTPPLPPTPTPAPPAPTTVLGSRPNGAPTAPPEAPPQPASTTTSVPKTTRTTAVQGKAVGDDQASGHADGGMNTTPIVVALGGLASAALAVGAKRAVERRRRRFSAAHPGSISAPTSEGERQIHRQIVANADEEGIDDLRSILAGLAVGTAATGIEARPRIVQHSDEHLDVLLDHPWPVAPEGWTVEGDGELWSFDPAAGDTSPTTDCAAPLLVTLGQPDDGAQLYLDLEADCLIELTGDQGQALNLARSVVTEVALSPLTDTVRVIVVGDLLGVVISSLEHVAVVDHWKEVEDDVAAWAEQSHGALVTSEWPNTFVGRGVDPDHEALAPLLVVSSEPPPEALADKLVANRPASLAVLVAGEFPAAACTIDCQPDSLTVADLDLSCVPQSLDADFLAAMIRLLDSTDVPAAATMDDPEIESTPLEYCESDEVDGSEVVLDIRERDAAAIDQPELFSEVVGRERADGGELDDAAHEQAEPDFEILVHFLGDVRVEGGSTLTPKPTAVVAYIALHGSVTVEALEDACWSDPSKGSLRKRLKDVMTECRTSLGSHNLPVAKGGRYVVGPGVMTDTKLFELRVARAASQPAAEQVETYRSALDLVTGKVFTYPGRAGASFGWIDVENLISQWEVKIQGVALQCIETYRSIGAPEQAAEVATHVLAALPLNTPLTEALMRAHAESGQLVAVETVYQAHVDGLARIHKADPENATQDLRRHLVTTGASDC